MLWNFELFLCREFPHIITLYIFSVPNCYQTQPRTFVPRALLYNDGGFDISPDGQTLCACAEYWLPDGINSAMELIGRGEENLDDCLDDDDSSGTCSDDDIDIDPNQVSMMQDGDAMDASIHSSHERRSASANSSSPPRPPLPHHGSSSAASFGTPSVTGTSSVALSMPPPSQQQPIQHGTGGQGLIPQTPPATQPQSYSLSPPSPPGRRFHGGLGQQQQQQQNQSQQQHNQRSNPETSAATGQLSEGDVNVMTPPRSQSSDSSSSLGSTGNRATSVPEAPPAMDMPRRPTLTASDATQAAAATTTPVREGLQDEGNHGSTSTPVASGDGSQQHQQLIAPPAPRPRHRQSHQQQHYQSTFNNTSSGGTNSSSPGGRFVPHVVTISLDTTPYVEMIPVDVDHQQNTKQMNLPTTTRGGDETKQQQQGDGIIGSRRGRNIQECLRPKLHIPGRLQASASQANGGGGSDDSTKILDPALLLSSSAQSSGPAASLNRRRPRLGQVLEACPLDGTKASAVTCVKFSPSCDYLLIGYGVRDPVSQQNHPNGSTADGSNNTHPPYHPVTALYRCRGKMEHVSTMLSSDDDVNIARFHPLSGSGFVYGTKQGRVRVLGPRPWNYYNM